MANSKQSIMKNITILLTADAHNSVPFDKDGGRDIGDSEFIFGTGTHPIDASDRDKLDEIISHFCANTDPEETPDKVMFVFRYGAYVMSPQALIAWQKPRDITFRGESHGDQRPVIRIQDNLEYGDAYAIKTEGFVRELKIGNLVFDCKVESQPRWLLTQPGYKMRGLWTRATRTKLHNVTLMNIGAVGHGEQEQHLSPGTETFGFACRSVPAEGSWIEMNQCEVVGMHLKQGGYGTGFIVRTADYMSDDNQSLWFDVGDKFHGLPIIPPGRRQTLSADIRGCQVVDGPLGGIGFGCSVSENVRFNYCQTDNVTYHFNSDTGPVDGLTLLKPEAIGCSAGIHVGNVGGHYSKFRHVKIIRPSIQSYGPFWSPKLRRWMRAHGIWLSGGVRGAQVIGMKMPTFEVPGSWGEPTDDDYRRWSAQSSGDSAFHWNERNNFFPLLSITKQWPNPVGSVSVYGSPEIEANMLVKVNTQQETTS